MSNKTPVITIDGPSGTGKGTMAQLLAQELGWNLLDSGALYRVLALAAKQHGVDLKNEEALEVLAGHLDVQFKATAIGQPAQITLEGENVTDAIRAEEIGNLASQIAVYSRVRQALLERQRAFREEPGLVTDGRDMGTVVFPDAQLKVFLVASPEERAKRRYIQLTGQPKAQLKGKSNNVSLDQILTELVERDLRDRGRAVAPLKPAEDAIIIDTSGYSIEEVMERIMEEVEARLVEVA